MRSKNAFVQIACLTVFTTVGLFSCQPKDVDHKEYVAVLKAKKFGDTSKSASVEIKMTENETNSVMALSFDRMAESVFLIKTVLNSEFAAQNYLIKKQEENVQSSDELPTTILESIPFESKKNTTGNFKYIVDEISVDVSGKLRKLVLTKSVFDSVVFVGKNLKKNDFKIVNVSDRITVRLTADENVYLVKISRSDATSSKADKNTTLNFESKFKLAWDGQISNLNNDLQISNIFMKAVRTGSKSGEMIYENNQQNLTINVGQCVSLNGRLNMDANLSKPDQKMTNPSEIILSDSTIEISNSKFKSTAAPCENRAVVDLTRMLN